MELSEFSQIPVWLRELRELNMLSVTIRLLLALLSGTLIGIDRGMKRRGAGIKTHVLVCLGATLVMMTGQYIVDYFGTRQEVQRSRLFGSRYDHCNGPESGKRTHYGGGALGLCLYRTCVGNRVL